MAVKRKLLLLAAILLAAGGLVGWLSTAYGGAPQMWSAPGGTVNWTAQESEGPVTVRIGSSRDSGYRIGDIITMHVVVVADAGVPVDISPLERGVFLAYGESDFELAGSQVSRHDAHGKRIWEIVLQVRSWKVDETIDFTVEIPYATRDEDGTLSWTSIMSPTVSVHTTRSAQKGDQLDQGNRNLVSRDSQNIGRTFVFFGIWLLISLAAWKTLLLFPRMRKLLAATPNARAWKVLDAVFEGARKNGWTEQHYIRIAAVLRQFMDLETIALNDLASALAEHPQADIALRVFTLLEGTLYAKRELGGIERAQLETDLETLIPRP